MLLAAAHRESAAPSRSSTAADPQKSTKETNPFRNWSPLPSHPASNGNRAGLGITPETVGSTPSARERAVRRALSGYTFVTLPPKRRKAAGLSPVLLY